MDVLLILDGKVENCICADSVERAQQFYPQHICIERTEALREAVAADPIYGATA